MHEGRIGMRHLLALLGVLILVASVLAGCGGAPTAPPEASPSPEVSATDTPVVPQGATETPVIFQSPVETPGTFLSPLATPVSGQTAAEGMCPQGCLDPTEECLIKAVVTGMGDRLYYLPGAEGYEDALLLVKYGGRWFCTEEEATRNDFAKAP